MKLEKAKDVIVEVVDLVKYHAELMDEYPVSELNDMLRSLDCRKQSLTAALEHVETELGYEVSLADLKPEEEEEPEDEQTDDDA